MRFSERRREEEAAEFCRIGGAIEERERERESARERERRDETRRDENKHKEETLIA